MAIVGAIICMSLGQMRGGNEVEVDSCVGFSGGINLDHAMRKEEIRWLRGARWEEDDEMRQR